MPDPGELIRKLGYAQHKSIYHVESLEPSSRYWQLLPLPLEDYNHSTRANLIPHTAHRKHWHPLLELVDRYFLVVHYSLGYSPPLLSFQNPLLEFLQLLNCY